MPRSEALVLGTYVGGVCVCQLLNEIRPIQSCSTQACPFKLPDTGKFVLVSCVAEPDASGKQLCDAQRLGLTDEEWMENPLDSLTGISMTPDKQQCVISTSQSVLSFGLSHKLTIVEPVHLAGATAYRISWLIQAADWRMGYPRTQVHARGDGTV